YWVYDLPFGRGKRFGNGQGEWMDRIIGGWQISGLLTLESGRPFTVYSGSNTVSSVRQTPANCSGNCLHMGEVFNDPASSFKFYSISTQAGQFATPAAGDFSNTGRNFFRGPGFFGMDASFAKNVRLTERFKLQLRADASNLTNHPSFDIPTASAVITN